MMRRINAHKNSNYILGLGCSVGSLYGCINDQAAIPDQVNETRQIIMLVMLRPLYSTLYGCFYNLVVFLAWSL